MSQEKVDAYKKEKANRKKTMQSAKRKSLIYKITGCLITALLVAWLVCSIGWRHFGWYNPFAEKETSRVLSDEEKQSIRDNMNIDESGNSITTTASDTTTQVNDGTSAAETDTTSANAANDEKSNTP